MNFDSQNRDPEVEKLLDSLPKEEANIYRYMREEYDRVTNNGENYDETHDDLVARLARDKFNISEEKAGQIYIDVEFKVSKFQKKRFETM
ncbi:hypothetical protein [Paenibacillus alvei]|uniref:hypothetical protein n=1 Tax=Paenibacillus alvei TaxID=44250 RepID=UPI000289BF65|nr:hypothetical protein [Paenibacillus alvei]EJW14740.1 hypothetical protein PAV_11c00810 [Paenibacillus alvei DSM 29]MCY9540937.1 hypothetical protein [Paenibacillus alvei]MCY9708159.1 hypothetical protein [Paenibacillus alvei]MEC0080208.1 hypothetical protein [Paenibacillus alvei]NEZ43327.1 hypothetical protein [Paenibacillus alvei]